MAVDKAIKAQLAASGALLALAVAVDFCGGGGAATATATAAAAGGAGGLSAGGVLSSLGTVLAAGAGNSLWNVVTGMFARHTEQRAADLACKARGTGNHDLHRLIGESVEHILNEEFDRATSLPTARLVIGEVRTNFQSQWPDLNLDENYADISAEGIIDLLKRGERAVMDEPVLSHAAWRTLVRSWWTGPLDAEREAVLSDLASALSARFGRTVMEKAKRAWKDNDPAWPALHLRAVSRTLTEIDAVKTQNLHLHDDIHALRAALRDVADFSAKDAGRIIDTLTGKLDAVQAAVIAEIRELARELTSVHGLQLNSLTDLHAKVDRIERTLAKVPVEVVRELERGGYVTRPRPASPTSNVPTPSPTFVKRKNLTLKIHNALEKGTREAVLRQAVARAMGGYGKTVAAILYAEEYKDSYPGGRFFLSVESGELTTALASLVGNLGITASTNPEADADKVKSALESGQASLLILDNVASKAAWAAMLGSGLVPRGACRVLITTRDEHIHPEDAVQVERLSNAEAREVFRLFCQDRKKKPGDAEPLPPDDVADAINVWLGGLAVAIGAVAALMKLKPHLDWTIYWAGNGAAKGSGTVRGLKNTPVGELPDVRPEVQAQLGINGKALEEHRRTLAVIDAAYDALPDAEKRAVEYAALLRPDLAPAVWLEELLQANAAEKNGSPLAIALPPTDPDDPLSPAHRVLKHLDQLDVLLPGGEGGKLLNLHRLWHARINEKATAEKLDRTALLLAIAACAAGRRGVILGTNPDGSDRNVDNPAALTDQTLRWEIAPLSAVCQDLWVRHRPGEAARVGVWLASVLRLLGRFAEASVCLPLSATTDDQVEAAIGHQDLAASYSNLALIQKDQGELDGARASMERAIAIKEKYFAPDHPTFASSYSNLAMIQQHQGELAGARASMERAIAINQKHFAPDHPTFAIRYSNLAIIQYTQGDLPGARASMERAIAIEEKHFAPDHPTFATRYSNLALIQKDQGDLPGARASMERAIAIGEKHLGTDHPLLATHSSNLALIQRDQGELAGARASMERAIAIDQKHFAPDHPTFATSYANLAMIQKDQSDLPGARASMERAIAIDQKHFAPDHPTFATRYSNLALIQRAQGDLPGARASMERAIAIAQKHFAPDHPTFAISYNNLAHVCYAEGDRAAACANFKKALGILLTHFDENHPHVKSVRADMKFAGCSGE